MKIYFSVVFLFFTLFFSAQESIPTQVNKLGESLPEGEAGPLVGLKKVWTLQDCISYAIENNITVKEAVLNENSAEVNLVQSKSSRLPNLTGSASQSMSSGNSIDPITSDYITKQNHSTNIGINSTITLFKGNQISNQIKQNKLLIDQNSLYVEESKNNITLSVLEAYLQALYNKEGIVVSENNFAASEKEVARAKARLDAGSISMIDYTDALSQAATNKYNIISTKNSYAQQILVLKQLLELGPFEELEIESVADDSSFINLVPNKIDIYEKALNNLPEINASKLTVKINEKDLDIAKGGYLPTLSLSGSLGSGYTSIDYTNFIDQLDINFNQRLGLSLSVPIFNRNQTKVQVQNAKINIEKAELQQTSTEKEIYRKVETAWQNSISSQEQLIAAEASRNAAEESYKLAQKKYELGALSTTDLVVSQNTYTNAEQNYLQAKYLSILYNQLLQFYQGNEIKL